LAKLDAVHLADRDVRLLSGGERQRVALATTFAQEAPLVLLDEPSSHLDWSHQRLLRDRLLEWSPRRGTVLAAVHDVNLAWTLATHALLLDGNGRVIHGRRDEVLTAEAIGLAYGLAVKVVGDEDGRWFHAKLEHHA
jgi:iron complex transport system ATP-binding protein